MNIFVILIMGIMLATYQYFIAKRSSDVVLNKDELKLQAELTCMKQYHDFATVKNEYLYEVGNEIFSLKGTGQDQANYSCNGSDDPTFKVSKYCLSSTGQERVDCNFDGISCADTSSTAPGYHCVSTTKWKTFSKSDKYLMSQILKNGVNISSKELSANLQLIKDRAGVFADRPTVKEGEVLTAIGLVSCVNACKVSLQTKLKDGGCPEGTVIVAKEDGSLECAKPTDASPCTAYEAEYTDKTKAETGWCTDEKKGGTGKMQNGKYCCAIRFYAGNDEYCKKHTNAANCCPPGLSPQWDGENRQYNCIDTNVVCQGNVAMKIIDEKGKSVSALGSVAAVPNAATTQYTFNSTTKTDKYYCHLKPAEFTKICKSFENEEYSFIKVSGVTNSTNIESSNFGGVQAGTSSETPVCHLAARANAKAAENCTPCQGVIFNKENNKWQCHDFTWQDLTNPSSQYYNYARSVVFGKDAKGRNNCLSTCVSQQVEAIKKGERNRLYWGVRFDPKSHMWNCFNCNPYDTHNYVWECEEKYKDGDKELTRRAGAPKNVSSIDKYAENSASFKYKSVGSLENLNKEFDAVCVKYSDRDTNDQGKCVPYNCSSDFQVQINGKCYTKWCSRKSAGFPSDAEINGPEDSVCPDKTPWMMYNTVKTCVYCIRQPANRIGVEEKP